MLVLLVFWTSETYQREKILLDRILLIMEE